jgi:signal transduction histidine kinase
MVFELEKAAVRMGLALQRFQIQHQLNQSLADQRDLSGRLLKAQEEEQRRIAMDLHDQTGQDLNVLKLRLAAIAHKLRKDQTGLKDECWQVLEFASRIIDDVRRIAHGLNPSLLEILGLRAALQQLIRDFSQGNRIQVIAETEALEMVRDRSSQLTLYRIIQEALTNASKHAKAATVRIIARVADTRLNLFIQDDGQGFDLLHFRDARKGQRGMGLDAMALRARMIGAEWNIVSQPAQGTQITLSLPLDLETFT